MASVQTYTGRLLMAGDAPEDAPEGWLQVQDGRVVDHGEGAPDVRGATEVGWILPHLVDAHTHVGDTALRDAPGMPDTVSALFGPGGFKHRHLERLEPEAMADGIRTYVAEMARVGVRRFIDFREGGLPGVARLAALAPELPARPVILGRPAQNGHDAAEAEALLPHVDGIGLSGMRDFPRGKDLEAWADLCHAARKPFSVHVSEAHRDDMDAVLALEPTFIVHMTCATRGDLRAAADAQVPIVVCPRSNAHFGRKPPLPQMRDAGCTVAVGTDNGMLQDGDLLKELALLDRWFPEVGEAALLRMASHNGHALLGAPTRFLHRGGAPPLRLAEGAVRARHDSAVRSVGGHDTPGPATAAPGRPEAP